MFQRRRKGTLMKEKLIELLKSCCKGEKPCVDDCFVCMADHLISHGVTVPVGEEIEFDYEAEDD